MGKIARGQQAVIIGCAGDFAHLIMLPLIGMRSPNVQSGMAPLA